jgi:hypothetical protein
MGGKRPLRARPGFAGQQQRQHAVVGAQELTIRSP